MVGWCCLRALWDILEQLIYLVNRSWPQVGQFVPAYSCLDHEPLLAPPRRRYRCRPAGKMSILNPERLRKESHLTNAISTQAPHLGISYDSNLRSRHCGLTLGLLLVTGHDFPISTKSHNTFSTRTPSPGRRGGRRRCLWHWRHTNKHPEFQGCKPYWEVAKELGHRLVLA